MLNTISPRLAGAAVLAAALTACASAPQQPRSAITPAKAQAAYAVGERLAAADRRGEAEHRAEMARLIDATVPRTRESDRSIVLLLRLRNKAPKAVKAIDAGVEVRDAHGKRIGLSEIHVARAVGAHGEAAFWYPMRYVRFSEDAGSMRLAQGKPKTVDLEVTEIRYADGSDAGYDD